MKNSLIVSQGSLSSPAINNNFAKTRQREGFVFGKHLYPMKYRIFT